MQLTRRSLISSRRRAVFRHGHHWDISNNTVYRRGRGDQLDYALDIQRRGDVDVFDTHDYQQSVVASSDGSTSAGVLVSTYFGGGTVANIQNNFITGNATGVFIGFDAIHYQHRHGSRQ